MGWWERFGWHSLDPLAYYLLFYHIEDQLGLGLNLRITIY